MPKGSKPKGSNGLGLIPPSFKMIWTPIGIENGNLVMKKICIPVSLIIDEEEQTVPIQDDSDKEVMSIINTDTSQQGSIDGEVISDNDKGSFEERGLDSSYELYSDNSQDTDPYEFFSDFSDDDPDYCSSEDQKSEKNSCVSEGKIEGNSIIRNETMEEPVSERVSKKAQPKEGGASATSDKSLDIDKIKDEGISESIRRMCNKVPDFHKYIGKRITYVLHLDVYIDGKKHKISKVANTNYEIKSFSNFVSAIRGFIYFLCFKYNTGIESMDIMYMFEYSEKVYKSILECDSLVHPYFQSKKRKITFYKFDVSFFLFMERLKTENKLRKLYVNSKYIVVNKP